MSKPRFKRGEGRLPGAKDARGSVRVAVCLKSPDRQGGNSRGNITRYCTVLDSTVSEVMEAIEAALFGERP